MLMQCCPLFSYSSKQQCSSIDLLKKKESICVRTWFPKYIQTPNNNSNNKQRYFVSICIINIIHTTAVQIIVSSQEYCCISSHSIIYDVVLLYELLFARAGLNQNKLTPHSHSHFLCKIQQRRGQQQTKLLGLEAALTGRKCRTPFYPGLSLFRMTR